MKNIQYIIGIILILIGLGEVKSQERLKMVEQNTLPTNQNNIYRIMVDNSTGEVYRKFKNLISVTPYPFPRGEIHNDVQYERGLIDEKGNRILVGPKEEIINVQGNEIIVVDRDYNSYKTILKKYNVSGPNLTLIKSATFDHAEVSVSYLNKLDVIVVHNMDAVIGEIVEVYNRDFKGVIGYHPYPGSLGFKGFNIGGYGKKLMIITYPSNKTDKKRMVVFDSESGVEIFRKDYEEPSYGVAAIYAFEDFVIFFASEAEINPEGDRKIESFLICSNWKGDFLWKRKANLPTFHQAIAVKVGKNQDEIFAKTGTSTIEAISCKTGKLIWSQNFSNHYTFSTKPPTDGWEQATGRNGYQIIDFEINDHGEVVVVGGQMDYSPVTNKFRYREAEMFNVSPENGEINQSIPINGNYFFRKVIKNKKEVRVISEKNIENYAPVN